MQETEIQVLIVGTDGEQVVDSATTKKQIAEVAALECAPEHEGNKMAWKDLDNPEQPRTIFQSILRDRELRVDKHTPMADRPALQLVFDPRSRDLQGKKLPNFLESDPHTYDPTKFLKEFMGIPEEFSKPVLDAVHNQGA